MRRVETNYARSRCAESRRTYARSRCAESRRTHARMARLITMYDPASRREHHPHHPRRRSLVSLVSPVHLLLRLLLLHPSPWSCPPFFPRTWPRATRRSSACAARGRRRAKMSAARSPSPSPFFDLFFSSRAARADISAPVVRASSSPTVRTRGTRERRLLATAASDDVGRILCCVDRLLAAHDPHEHLGHVTLELDVRVDDVFRFIFAAAVCAEELVDVFLGDLAVDAA